MALAEQKRAEEPAPVGRGLAVATLAAAGAIGGAVLVLLLSLTPFLRFTGDDFSEAGFIRRMGFWGSQAFWFHTWSGRVTRQFLLNVFASLGPHLVWLPTVLTVVVSAYLLQVILKRLLHRGPENTWLSWSNALLLLGAGFATTPAATELLFWITGEVTYTIALPAGLGFLAAWMMESEAEEKEGIGRRICWFAAAAVVSAINETSAAMFCAGTFFLYLRALKRREVRSQLLLWATVGFIVGTAVTGIAPGNIARYHVLNATGGGRKDVSAINTVLLTVFYLPYRLLRQFTGWSCLVWLTGAAAGLMHSEGEESPARLDSKRLVSLLEIVGSMFALCIAACIPSSVVSAATRPPDRALLFPHLVFLFAMGYFGLLVGRALSGKLDARGVRIASALVLLLAMAAMLTGPRRDAIRIAKVVPEARAFAAHWDQMDQNIRERVARGEKEISIPPVPTDFANVYVSYGFSQWNEAEGDELSIHKSHWVNQSFDYYYGTTSIRVSDDAGDPRRRLDEPLTEPTRH